MTMIAKRLKKLRGSAGLNQSQLARSVGVTRAAASRWEQGDIDSILAKNAIRVANTLGTSVEYLFTGKTSLDQELDVEALSRSISIVNNELKELSSNGQAAIIALVYQLMINGKPISKNVVRQLKKAA
jgi:transcriptional regulator with XRE-family HTH domain